MTTFYLDPVGGNDSNAGTSFALRWKTFTSGATAARIAPGDTIRVMSSKDPTSLGQTATWTKGSKTVTLTTAVTADIDTCETAWTASANVTTSTTSTRKEGSLATQIAIGTSFTTGLAAYKALAGATDFSAYTQISFAFQWPGAGTINPPVNGLQLKLCSDAAGVTAVDTFDIPAININSSAKWWMITLDKGSALGSSIQSIALYVVTDYGASTIILDNIIACKAPASADSLTLSSMIGKAHNLNWAASTTYAANDIRKPTTPNRNGFRYKVTAGGGGNSGSSEPTWPREVGVTVVDGALTWTCDSLEETWYPIQSIRGTTVLLDAGLDSAANTTIRGYHGTTETVTTAKREPFVLAYAAGAATSIGNVQDSGTDGSPIRFDGGWDQTAMSSQTGETWLAAPANDGIGMYFNNQTWVTFANFGVTRWGNTGGGLLYSAGSGCRLENFHVSGCAQGVSSTGSPNDLALDGVVIQGNTVGGFSQAASCKITARCFAVHSNVGVGFAGNLQGTFDGNWIEGRNNLTNAFQFPKPYAPENVSIRNIITSDNGGTPLNFTSSTGFGRLRIRNASIGEATVSDFTTFPQTDAYLYVEKNAQTADNHIIYANGGTIQSATDQRNTGSGISWKFLVTSTIRHSVYPLKMNLPRIACAANALVTLGIYVRRDNTSIKGRVRIRGGQLAGVPDDVTVDCQPSVNTWTQYTLTFTPTEAGVVEPVFECYDGVGTTRTLWVDDFSASQA